MLGSGKDGRHATGNQTKPNQTKQNKMKIEIETQLYNERRYGKPYIATMDFSSAQGIPTWGQWVGSPGEPGLLILDAEPGAIVMRGQKDNRKPRNSAPDFYRLENDGSLTALESKAAAYRAWTGAVKQVEA